MDQAIADAMRQAEANQTQIPLQAGFGLVWMRMGSKLALMLPMIVVGDAAQFIMEVTESEGFEMWRRFCRQYESKTAVGTMLTKITNPVGRFSEATPELKISAWKKYKKA